MTYYMISYIQVHLTLHCIVLNMPVKWKKYILKNLRPMSHRLVARTANNLKYHPKGNDTWWKGGWTKGTKGMKEKLWRPSRAWLGTSAWCPECLYPPPNPEKSGKLGNGKISKQKTILEIIRSVVDTYAESARIIRQPGDETCGKSKNLPTLAGSTCNLERPGFRLHRLLANALKSAFHSSESQCKKLMIWYGPMDGPIDWLWQRNTVLLSHSLCEPEGITAHAEKSFIELIKLR